MSDEERLEDFKKDCVNLVRYLERFAKKYKTLITMENRPIEFQEVMNKVEKSIGEMVNDFEQTSATT